MKYYPPQFLGAQVITREWAQPVDAVHKLYKVTSDVKDPDGNILVTAYALERPDRKWSVMLVNKDPDNSHSVKVSFADDSGGNRFFSGAVDRIVFGAAEYQWHPDPVPPGAVPEAGEAGGGGRAVMSGHPDPDGPPSKSSLTGCGAETLYELPKASMIVLRGNIALE